ncbi:MAG TPA: hypothetical protein VL691_15735, partial [Vicinamibacteria bacterium]|nr:hypothetical protein [Vicinamibacteria bacterium]
MKPLLFRVGLSVSLAAALALAFPLVDCRRGPQGGRPLRRTKARVFGMGFDGMDPTLARRWMDEG